MECFAVATIVTAMIAETAVLSSVRQVDWQPLFEPTPFAPRITSVSGTTQTDSMAASPFPVEKSRQQRPVALFRRPMRGKDTFEGIG
jgi:hypothetical protein